MTIPSRIGRFLGPLFALYFISLMSSMAGMELFSWLIFLLSIFAVGFGMAHNGLKQTFKSLRLGPGGIDLTLWLFFIWIIAGTLNSPATAREKWDMVGYVRWILLLYAFSFLFKNLYLPNWSRALKLLAVLLLLTGLYCLLQSFAGIEFFHSKYSKETHGLFTRATGFFNNPLTLAYVLGQWSLVAIPAALFTLNKSNIGTRQKFLWGLVIVAGATIMLLSLTRGAWFGWGLALFYLIFVLQPKWFARSLIASVVLGGALYFTVPVIQSKVNAVFDSSNSNRNVRVMVWHANWELFKDHPLLGVGLNENYKYLREYSDRLGYQDRKDFVGHAHNNYLQILASTGLVGFLLYLGFSFYFLKLAYRLSRDLPIESLEAQLALGIFSAQVFFHLGGLTECNFKDGETNHSLVFLWAVVLGLYHWYGKAQLDKGVRPL